MVVLNEDLVEVNAGIFGELGGCDSCDRRTLEGGLGDMVESD